MKTTKWADIKHKSSPEVRARKKQEAVAELDRLGLGSLRKAQEQTQQELAKTLGIPQPAVSKIENQTDLLLSTMGRYVEALGGKLEVKATFPGGGEFNLAEGIFPDQTKARTRTKKSTAQTRRKGKGLNQSCVMAVSD